MHCHTESCAMSEPLVQGLGQHLKAASLLQKCIDLGGAENIIEASLLRGECLLQLKEVMCQTQTSSPPKASTILLCGSL